MLDEHFPVDLREVLRSDVSAGTWHLYGRRALDVGS